MSRIWFCDFIFFTVHLFLLNLFFTFLKFLELKKMTHVEVWNRGKMAPRMKTEQEKDATNLTSVTKNSNCASCIHRRSLCTTLITDRLNHRLLFNSGVKISDSHDGKWSISMWHTNHPPLCHLSACLVVLMKMQGKFRSILHWLSDTPVLS